MSVRNEARWWARALVRIGMNPGLLLLVVAVVWLSHPWGVLFLNCLLVLTAGLRALLAWRPAIHLRWVAPLLGRVRARRVRLAWIGVCARCGLTVGEEAPRLLRTRVSWPHVEIRVSPVMGQTVEHFEGAAEALRTSVAASRLRIQPFGTREVLLTFTLDDYLQAPFSASPVDASTLGAVVMGRREDGQPWRLALGPHTLVAGSSGAGKGSVFWSFAFGLAGSVRAGTVQLHGVDLKGGMEIMMGRSLFTTAATSPLEAVALLEDLVEQMQARSRRYAGHLRSHTATTQEPLHVVMIDELAALTAYSNERDLQRRAETAINLLCSQGRAPGFMLFACLQDPRKEVIPSRGLFTQMVGLRLKDISETTMVLGEIAALTGAYCHRITRDVPGTGYVLPEDGSHPIRVRAGFASDESIREVACAYATPVRQAVDTTRVEDSLTARRPRPRAQEGVA